jgi:DNA primase
MHRLIIPVYLNGEFVSFQGADLTGKADLKYKAGTDNIKSLLYNYDGIEDVMVVTEGVLDAWRVGDNAVCSFGTSITDDQKQLIINKNLKHLVFMWDSDAYWYAKKEAEYFRPFVDIVDVIKLPPDADPDEMEHEELNKILYGD